jgi:hypothetical protein
MENNFFEEFEKFKKKIGPYLSETEKILGTALSDEPEELISDMKTIEAKNSYIGRLLAQAESYLDKATVVYMPDKEGLTEMERKAVLNADVSDYRKWRDRIESILKSIDTRLSVGQSILRYISQRPK